MRANGTISMLAAGAVLCVFFPGESGADLVKRAMYTNAAGETVSQYVYQGGKSGRSRYARSSGYGYGYGYGYAPYAGGGYFRSGTCLQVRPHSFHGGYASGGHVRGSYSGGNVRVFVRW
jgi:hypothetical protein